ncbi:hypothetical protein ACFL13_01080 [Patescibacteria group bacterium]
MTQMSLKDLYVKLAEVNSEIRACKDAIGSPEVDVFKNDKQQRNLEVFRDGILSQIEKKEKEKELDLPKA